LDNCLHLPLVTALVAAWNEAAQIQPLIESFLNLRYPHKQLVLVAGGEDGTFTLARRCAGSQVRVLEQRCGEGKQRALRRAFDLATGEIIYLTDADCRFDNASFERMIWPIAAYNEQVVTGASRPYPADLKNPFIVNQYASQIYASYYTSRYATGILGRNCAVLSDLLARSRALDLPAATGTDYVLAQALVQSGARIRHEPASQVVTRYPGRIGAYLRQQRRWLLNLYRHGQRFGVVTDQRAALQTMLFGLGMLALSLSIPFFGLLSAALWSVLAFHACLSRLRYVFFSARILGFAPTLRDYLATPLCFLIDLFAWTLPLLDVLGPRRQVPW
jgi:cellulose synthase/poly-beta-1,6-N-acetylglucosamine synthase-like glycosyltransferase